MSGLQLLSMKEALSPAITGHLAMPYPFVHIEGTCELLIVHGKGSFLITSINRERRTPVSSCYTKSVHNVIKTRFTSVIILSSIVNNTANHYNWAPKEKGGNITPPRNGRKREECGAKKVQRKKEKSCFLFSLNWFYSTKCYSVKIVKAKQF